MKRVVGFCFTLVFLTSCIVSSQYVGKSYAPTTLVDIFMTWEDVPRDYEVMGYADATPSGLSSIEHAQKKVEALARQKGADAIVFEGIDTRYGNPTLETTEKTEKNSDGTYTKKITTAENVEIFSILKVTFIKYRR